MGPILVIIVPHEGQGPSICANTWVRSVGRPAERSSRSCVIAGGPEGNIFSLAQEELLSVLDMFGQYLLPKDHEDINHHPIALLKQIESSPSSPHPPQRTPLSLSDHLRSCLKA